MKRGSLKLLENQSELSSRFPCACCGFLTLSDPQIGSYEICPVCCWEDDPVQNSDPSFAGGANATSLMCARENYIRFGACDPVLSARVRPPNIEEVPRPASLPGLESDKRDARVRGIKTALLGIVQAMLSDRISIFDGCTAISALTWGFVSEPESGEYSVFDGAASEIEDLPNGRTRHLWSPDALNREEAKAADYERRIQASVKAACSRLQEHLRKELLTYRK